MTPRSRWSRGRPPGWPSEKALWRNLAFVLVAATFCGVVLDQYQRWTPLERYYVSAYSGTWWRNALSFLVGPTARYKLLLLDRTEKPDRTTKPDRQEKKEYLAVDGAGGDVVLIREPGPDGNPVYDLLPEAKAFGYRNPRWEDETADNAKLHAQLLAVIYRKQPPLGTLGLPALEWSLGVLLVGWGASVPLDQRRRRPLREGRRVGDGPELVTLHQFNHKRQGDGVSILAGGRRGWEEWMEYLPGPRRVRLSMHEERKNFLILGDQETGKSVLVRQLLKQIRDRGETAIVHDPSREYTRQFYSQERGDVILNPADARAPYWNPFEELQRQSQEATLAESLFPDRAAARRVFAHMLERRLPLEELRRSLCQAEEIGQRAAGIARAATEDRQAGAWEEAVKAMRQAGETLRLLPGEGEAEKRWNTVEWSRKPQGWLFLTSTPVMRAQLRPLLSLWMDLLVLRVMNQGAPLSGCCPSASRVGRHFQRTEKRFTHCSGGRRRAGERGAPGKRARGAGGSRALRAGTHGRRPRARDHRQMDCGEVRARQCAAGGRLRRAAASHTRGVLQYHRGRRWEGALCAAPGAIPEPAIRNGSVSVRAGVPVAGTGL